MATVPKSKPVKPAENLKKEDTAETKPEARNFFAEWAVTILILLFGTSTLLQAFVVPTGPVWPFPAYELALLTAREAYGMGQDVTASIGCIKAFTIRGTMRRGSSRATDSCASRNAIPISAAKCRRMFMRCRGAILWSTS